MNNIITNGNEIKLRILSEINNSQKSIFLAMAFFTDRDIANSIIEASKRSVFVDVILSSNAQNETVKQMFRNENINIHAFETGDERGLMHHKFCLIDNKITINGSYNYSYNASNNNVENIHVTDDFSVYSQFYSEFERLKYNIDNNISVNTIPDNNNNNNNMELNNQPSHLDSFSQQLYNLVYLSTQINTEDYKKMGYEKSKESNGSIEIFKAEYSNIKEQMRLYEIDDTLTSKKSLLLSNINNAFENKKIDLNNEKENEVESNNSVVELEKKQVSEVILKFKNEKQALEIGSEITGEKGVFQLNKEIETNKLEINSLEKTFVVTKFGSLGNYLVVFFLFICLFYLSVFFSSALFKVFFEENIIAKSMNEGNVIPDKPQIIDANAAFKIFKMEEGGVVFGIISMLIFLFPLSLTNLNILGSKKKLVNTISFWLGLIIFDILVSVMVAINTDKINSMRQGIPSSLELWGVFKTGEFYLIFIFGMLPLFITHHLINYVTSAYRKSRKELINEEKYRTLEFLEKEKIELEFNKDLLLKKILNIEEKINEQHSIMTSIDKKLLEFNNAIDDKYTLILNQIKLIFDDYSAKITSGKIFTDVIQKSIISSFKTGFIDFLPVLYSVPEVANRVREIDREISSNIH